MPEVIDTPIESEMQSSYVDYAMSVIISRALPDARDGLKPAQRRILYAMYRLNNTHDQPTKKSARVVGDVIGKYHPHGDQAVYETLARMAQDFSMNYRLVEGQGNMGCFTADTKLRLTDGRHLSFKQLVEEQSEGKRHWAFTFNTSTNSIEVAEIKNPRLTRRNAELVQIILDNGEKLRCTPDHRFLLRTGTYKEAKELKAGDPLMPLYTRQYDGGEDKNLKGYETVLQPHNGKWQFVHHISDEWNIKEKIYAKTRGRIRHHIDFNKLNNNPNNITRLQWGEHWKLHYVLASWRHKNDKEYVRKLDEGRRKFIAENHHYLSMRASEMNRANWKKPAYRAKKIRRVKELWRDEKYRNRMRSISSKTLKEHWKSGAFRKLISKYKSEELKKRWQSKAYRAEMQQAMKEMSIKLWSNPQHRNHISSIMRERAKAPEWRAEKSKIAKALWKDQEYRNKFSKDHFVKMGKSAWTKEGNRVKLSDKARKQWEDPLFRALMIDSITTSDVKRLKRNPSMMKELAQAAKRALHKKWQDPLYRKRVIKSKILGFTSALLAKYQQVNPAVYESERRNNGIPRINRALQYFPSFEQMIEEAKTYNHKVKEIIYSAEREDTYDLTIDPWHNFALSAGVFAHNSIDGDPPAAMRYTEVRLERLAEEMLDDIEKESVKMVPNFDNTEQEPAILPAKVPNLLINGASGIAVGVATNILPHNLSEVCDAVTAYIDNRDITPEELMGNIKGPDFPTGGIVFHNNALAMSYTYGRGTVTLRGKTKEEKISNRTALIITEIPYTVNKSALVEEIANLVRSKRITSIADLRDESGREGIRIVIEPKQDADRNTLLNQLYSHTQLQTSMPVMNIAVLGNELVTLNVKQFIKIFVDHRLNVIKARSGYDLRVASDRLHIVDGLLAAVGDIDNIVATIKKSKDVKDARAALMEKYKLSEKQANAILDMKLGRLTSLETESLQKEKGELEKSIEHLKGILADEGKVYKIIKDETAQIKKTYGLPRRTEIDYAAPAQEFIQEDIIPDEEATIILTSNNYTKRMPTKVYREQERGGKGIIAIELKEGDFVKQIVSCRLKDYLLLLSNKGRAYWLKAYLVPEESRYGIGKALVNLVKLSEGERIRDIIDTKVFTDKYLTFITAKGRIKRVKAERFSRPRANGIKAMPLLQGDELADVCLSDGAQEMFIGTSAGKALRFKETDIRPMGREAHGIRGMKLNANDYVVNIESATPSDIIVSVTEKGYGKATPISKYRLQRRGGKGVINLRTKDKTGPVVKSLKAANDENILMINSKGLSIIFPASDIRVTGRGASGVRLMRLDQGVKVVDAQAMGKAKLEKK